MSTHDSKDEMAEQQKSGDVTRRSSVWTLRLAGGQDDANPNLWSPHVRYAGSAWTRLGRFLQRGRPLMLTTFLAVLAPAAAWVMLMTPAYEVTQRVFLEVAQAGEGYASRPVSPSEIAAEVERIRSRELLLKVVEANKLGAAASGGSDEEKAAAALARLEKDLDVRPTPESSVISIVYSNADPAKATAVASSLAKLYLEARASEGRDPEAEAREAESRRYAEELHAARLKLEEFEGRSRALLMENQQQSAAVRRAQLRGERNSTEAEIKGLEARLALWQKQQEALAAKNGDGPAQRLGGLSTLLESQAAELSSQYEPSHWLVHEVERRRTETKAALERAQGGVTDEAETTGPLRRAIDKDVRTTQSELAGLRKRRQEIVDALRATEGRQSQLEQVEQTQAELENAVKAAEANYLPHRKSETRSRSAELLGVRRLEASAGEPPSKPGLPPSQRRSLLFLVSLVTAAGAAIVAAVLYDPHLKPAAYVADIATATGAPVLMMVEETQSHVS